MKKTIIAVVAALPMLACAANWQLVSVSSNDNKFYIDGDSIAASGQYKKAWILQSYAKPQDDDSYPKKQYLSSKVLQYFDCKGRTTGPIMIAKYAGLDGSGESIGTASIKFSPDILQEVIPDTSGESILKAACGTAAYRTAIHKVLSQ